MRPLQTEAMPVSELEAGEEATYEEARAADTSTQHAQPEQALRPEPVQQQQQPDQAPAQLQAERAIPVEEVIVATTPQELEEVWAAIVRCCEYLLILHVPRHAIDPGTLCVAHAQIVPLPAQHAANACAGHGPTRGAARSGNSQGWAGSASPASAAGRPVGHRP